MIIGGVDEVGWGALAGPIVVGAVFLNAEVHGELELLKRQWWPLSSVKDSKKTSKMYREHHSGLFTSFINDTGGDAYFGVGTVQHINTVGFVEALEHAMVEAVEGCLDGMCEYPELLIVDGTRPVPGYSQRQWVVPKADNDYFVVALASLVAKIYRDDLMDELAEEYPEYLWDSNSGYGSQDHRDALGAYGGTKHHRKSAEKFMPAASRRNARKKLRA